MNSLSPETPASQGTHATNDKYYDESVWDDDDGITDKQLFIRRYHSSKDTFFCGLKDNPHGDITRVVRHKKSLQWKNSCKDDFVSHFTTSTYRWDKYTHGLENIHNVSSFAIDDDCGHSQRAKQEKMMKNLAALRNTSIKIRDVVETYGGFHSYFALAYPVYNDNLKAMKLLTFSQ